MVHEKIVTKVATVAVILVLLCIKHSRKRGIRLAIIGIVMLLDLDLSFVLYKLQQEKRHLLLAIIGIVHGRSGRYPGRSHDDQISIVTYSNACHGIITRDIGGIL
jgi:hypothetical protein